MHGEDGQDLVEVWQSIVTDVDKPWVLFEHGTCVILMQPEQDVEAQAVQLLREYGPVLVGTPAGDFDVIRPEKVPGWVVTCHHPDILNYVSPTEADEETADVVIGLLGRQKRDDDSRELHVVYVEKK